MKKEKDTIINPTEDSAIVSPMWQWCNRLRELFKADPEIEVGLAGTLNKPIIKIIVANQVKAICIEKLLPKEKKFGKCVVRIEVSIKNHFGGDKYLKDVVYEAFKGNPLFDYMYWWEDKEDQSSPYCWVTMSKDPVFFPESDLHNIYGDAVELPEDIATKIMPEFTDYIFYCTSNPDREMPDHNAKPFNDIPIEE